MACQENANASNPNLSLTSSPVPQVRMHLSGNLTGDLRKIKDLAADFHNLILKWETLNSMGSSIVTKISNIKIEKVFNDEDSSSLQFPEELNPLCEQLLSVVEEMGKIVEKLENKTIAAENLVSLKSFQKSVDSSSQLLFQTASLESVASMVRVILTSYKQELKLKCELCKQIAHAATRDQLMFFTCCWVHQPYLSIQTQSTLQALLTETGHITR